MYQSLLCDASFFDLLLRFDEDLAAEVRAKWLARYAFPSGCRRQAIVVEGVVVLATMR